MCSVDVRGKDPFILLFLVGLRAVYHYPTIYISTRSVVIHHEHILPSNGVNGLPTSKINDALNGRDNTIILYCCSFDNDSSSVCGYDDGSFRCTELRPIKNHADFRKIHSKYLREIN